MDFWLQSQQDDLNYRYKQFFRLELAIVSRISNKVF